MFRALLLVPLFLVACSAPPDETFLPKKAVPAGPPPVIQAQLNTDLSQFSIRYFTPVSRDAGDAPLADDGTEFTLVDVAPEGEVPDEAKRPSVVLNFSQSVVPLAQVGASAEGFATVQPPLAGTWRWLGTRVLALEPSVDLAELTDYTVQVKPGLKSLQGKLLAGRSSYSFHGVPLRLTGLTVGSEKESDLAEVPPTSAQSLYLTFNTAVDLSVAAALEVRVAGQRVVHTAKAGSKPQQLVLQLASPPPQDAEVEVVVPSGTRPRVGTAATEQPSSLVFHTLTPFQAYTDELDERFAIEFSHAIDPASAVAAVRVVPDVGLQASNVRVYGSTLRLAGLNVRPDSDYTVLVDPSLKDVFGRPLGERLKLSLRVGPPERYAVFPDQEARMLEKGSPAKIVWEGQNLDEGTQFVQVSREPYAPPSGLRTPLDVSGFLPNVRHLTSVPFGNLLNPNGTGWVEMGWSINLHERSGQPERTWLSVQVTDLGLTVRYGANKVVAWVTSLSTGQPVAGAKVTLQTWDERTVVSQNRASLNTDAQGLAVFALAKGEYARLFGLPRDGWVDDGLRVLVETAADRIVFAPNWSHNAWSAGIDVGEGPLEAQAKQPRTLVFTDRQLYRPGEKVTWRSLDKDLENGQYQSYQGPWRVILTSDEDDKALASVTGKASASGGSFGTLLLAADLKPGDYALNYQRPSADKSSGGWQTTVVEPVVVNLFRRLLFTLTAATPPVELVVGDPLKVKLSADYLSGGSVALGALEDFWTREPASFLPAGTAYESWAFGPPPLDSRTTLTEGKATLSGAGTYEVRQRSLTEGVLGLPYRYRYQATVTDPASHQSASTTASLLVHPGDFYIGIKLGGQNLDAESGWLGFLAQGQDTKLDAVLVRPNGTLFTPAGSSPPLSAEFVRHDWSEVEQQATGGALETRWVETLVPVATLGLPTAGGSGAVSWRPDRAGEYTVEVRGTDKGGRTVVTRKDFYVTGAEWVNWAGNADSLALTPERNLYQPSQTARILVRTPLPKGKYLVTVEREGVFDQRVVELTSASSTLEVPIKPEYLPVVYVSVASFTQRTGKLTHDYGSPDLDKPRGLYGVAALKVDSESRRIDLELVNDQSVYRPGAKASVTLKATHLGKPLADAEVTFLAVDRGVVDLIDYHVPDPLAYFYDRAFFPLMVRGADSRSLLIDPVNYVLRDQLGGAGDDGKLSERKDFQPTAVFEPSLKTNAQGLVTVTFQLPDSLTAYRSTAFAVKGDLYGLAEGNLAVRNPINVKATLPRKLRERDTTYSGVMVTNLDKAAQTVTVEASSDLLVVDKEASKKVTVEPGQTVEVAFYLAAPKAGTGTVSFVVRSALVNERLSEPFTVERPVVYETVATLGKLVTGKTATDFAEEALVLPSAAPDGLGSLTMTLDATRIASLGNSMRYLFDYPYGCLEQRSAKLLPLVLFGKYLPGYAAGWGLPGFDPQAVLTGEVKIFAASQLAEGGFPLWPGGQREQPYVTLRIAHILLLAQRGGLDIGSSIRLDALLARVRLLTAATKNDELYAYGLYLQALSGGAKTEVATRLDAAVRRWSSASASPATTETFALAGLAYAALGDPTRAKQVLDRLKAFLKPDARSVEIDVHRLRQFDEDPDSFTGSTVETYALVLMLVHQMTPESDLNQRLLNALVDREKNGVWGSTVENYWALQAFGQILADEEKQAPAFDLKVSVGNPAIELLTHRFEGVRADAQTVGLGFLSESLKGLPRDKPVPLRFEKTGPGTLFYTAELRYALPSELARAIDRGLEVVTQVLDDQGLPVQGNTLTVGKVYRMRALLSTGKTRTQVGLRLAVPSGAELLDARFTPSPRGEAYDDVETFLLDNEVQYVFPVLQAGSRQVEFLFRAVSQGVYPTPGASAEAMYTPEVFGRDVGRLYVLQTR